MQEKYYENQVNIVQKISNKRKYIQKKFKISEIGNTEVEVIRNAKN